MISNLTLTSLFVINIGLVIYLSINEKMHAQPWRMLALALTALIFTFWFQTSFDGLAAALDQAKPEKRHFEDIKLTLSLVNTIVGAFAGALIGTAVTNRAMHLNSKKLRELNVREEKCKDLFVEAETIKKELADQANVLSHQNFMDKHNQRELLLDIYFNEFHDIQDEKKKLSF